MKTYTLTFSERVENHVGMQQIGELATTGFTVGGLGEISGKFNTTELMDLGGGAAVLVIRNGLDQIFDMKASDVFFEEHQFLKPWWDRKAFMRGKVVNKHARHNLCFADIDQAPNYELGHGTIIDFKRISNTKMLRDYLHVFFGEKARNLYAEANYYYDVSKCYIGFHGDTERRRVIGVRLGATLPLHYQWYQNS